MSFAKGFEKTAALGRVFGGLATGVSSAAKGAAKSIKGYATGQRIGRYEGYTGTAMGRRNPLGGVAAGTAVKKMQATNPGMGFSELAGKAEQVAAGKQKEALTRLDRSRNYKANQAAPFYKKHPYMTAGAAFVGAKAMLGNDQQQPQQPPQIVQY